MGKNVAVFVDVANIFYAAKAAGVDIDYVTLLKAGSAGRDLVRAYAYTGLDPENENQRNFHDFLRRNGYKVVSKDIRKYGDGKVKANLDIELVVDMMKTARNLDVAIVVSGDGDFAPAIRAVQEMGVRVEVVSFRGNTSSDLMDVADQFTDIVQIAKVEKGSSRSGRRVAGDEQDLSMTEVPDKMTEGTGERTRGRGRVRRTTTGTATATTSRSRARVVEPEAGEAPIVVALPGEKLSRAAAAASAVPVADLDLDDDADADDLDEAGLPAGEGEAIDGEAPRRRRRRGGRGRGRSRGHEDGVFADRPAGVSTDGSAADALDDADDAEERPAPARRAASAFGSVWDSQIGIPAARRGAPATDDEEDFDEPAVPEYLLTERRQRDGNRGGPRGGRGRGGAYAAALDRERFGGGRGSTPSRFAEPPRPRDGGFGRPPRNDRPDRGDRPAFRSTPPPAPRPTGDEPWSEVPPEIEAMLRAQLGSKAAPAPRREAAPAPMPEVAPARAPRGRRPSVATPAMTESPMAATTAAPEAPVKARRAPVRRTTVATAAATDAETAAPAAKPSRAKAVKAGSAEAPPATPAARRATASRSTSKASATAGSADAPVADAPKKRAPRKKADTAG